jgi:hypothetical protein
MIAPTLIADAVQMEVFSNRMLAIAEDMGKILIRSSFSSNILRAPIATKSPPPWKL